MLKNKKKKRNYRIAEDPFLSLGFFNVVIYFFLMVISVAIPISPILILLVIKKAIAFSDSNVIASIIDNATILFSMPFAFIFLIITFVPFVRLLEQNCPIIRKNTEEEGYSPFKEDFIPLVKEIFREFYTDKAIKVLLWLLIPSLLLCSLTLFSRVDLHEDYSVTKYNIINQPSESYTTSDYKELTIMVHSHGSKGSKYWSYGIEILTEDTDEIYLRSGCFKYENHEETLDRMLEIKSLFSPRSIRIENEENLYKVIKDLNLNETEVKKLKELFSTP
jgi:hypothetical protein